jgi:ribose 1,5-bisphosphokinase
MSILFYIIGASGAGKDTLMNYARATINGDKAVIFSHRYITRPPGNSNENHVHLTAAEFNLRIEAGFFALHWESHGNHYGIGTEIDNWLEKGCNVVLNGSREYLPVARQLYPKMTVILIEASPETIINRLSSRGRETAEEIEKRIRRTREINADPGNCIKVYNNDTIESAGEELIKILSSQRENLILPAFSMEKSVG